MLEEQLLDLNCRLIILTLALPSGSSFALEVMPTDSVSRIRHMAKEFLKLDDFKGLQLVLSRLQISSLSSSSLPPLQ